MNFVYLAHVSTASEVAEQLCSKAKREGKGWKGVGEKERKREREWSEWWLFFKSYYFFSFVLAAILCHNYSTQENSNLIIYSYDKVLLLKYTPITETLQFAKIER